MNAQLQPAPLKRQEGPWRKFWDEMEAGRPLATPEEWEQAIKDRDADQQPPNPYQPKT